jgi:hypothetical protein
MMTPRTKGILGIRIEIVSMIAFAAWNIYILTSVSPLLNTFGLVLTEAIAIIPIMAFGALMLLGFLMYFSSVNVTWKEPPK